MHGATHIYALMGNRDFTMQVFDTIVIYFEMSAERNLHASHEICRETINQLCVTKYTAVADSLINQLIK